MNQNGPCPTIGCPGGSKPCQGRPQYRFRGLLVRIFAWIMGLLGVGVGVPVTLIFLAVAVCAALPDECQGGSLPMFGLILLEGFPCGWILSGLGCWILGRRLSRDHRAFRVLHLPLEYWGLILVGLGLLSVGVLPILVPEIR